MKLGSLDFPSFQRLEGRQFEIFPFTVVLVLSAISACPDVQDAVLERLRTLCDKDVDPKVRIRGSVQYKRRHLKYVGLI